jgi:hypothetical protein
MAKGLDLSQDLAFERADWRFQRALWIFLGVFVLAAISGLFGSGPLNHGRAKSRAELRAEFDRFPHVQTETEWVLWTDGSAKSCRVAVLGSCLKGMKIEAVDPYPTEAMAVGEGMVYQFRTSPGARAALHFRLTPQSPGPQLCRLTIGDDTVEFHQWVYP